MHKKVAESIRNEAGNFRIFFLETTVNILRWSASSDPTFQCSWLPNTFCVPAFHKEVMGLHNQPVCLFCYDLCFASITQQIALKSFAKERPHFFLPGGCCISS